MLTITTLFDENGVADGICYEYKFGEEVGRKRIYSPGFAKCAICWTSVSVDVFDKWVKSKEEIERQFNKDTDLDISAL